MTNSARIDFSRNKRATQNYTTVCW